MLEPNRYGYTISTGSFRIRPTHILPEQNRVIGVRLGIDHLPTPTMKAHALEARALIADHFHTNRGLYGK